jgi:hypothetical protein
MTVDDKVCEQVSLTLLTQIYPREVIERCVQQSEPWTTKVRRVRLSTALSLVLFVIARAISDSGLSGRRQALGSQCLQALMQERCQLLATPARDA